MSKPRLLRWAAVIAGLGFVLLQLVPYGRAHTNPPVRAEPAWDNPQTRTLAVRGCFDCHSNQTTWPWYASVAPMSWLIQHDVEEGRGSLNFTEWDRPQRRAGEAAEQVREGDMPPVYYVPLHPTARLTPQEQQSLAAGLGATLGERQERRSGRERG